MKSKKIALKFFIIAIFICFIYLFMGKVYAGTLSSASDTLSTSRPSSSIPLAADIAPGSKIFTVYNNGSTFLASDSAHFWGGNQEDNIISTTSGTTIFLNGATNNFHPKGSVISNAISAVHKIQFTTSSGIPSGGGIVLTFPISNSSDINQASPSASSFMFNNINSSEIMTNNVNCINWTFSVSAGSAFTMNCITSGAVASGTTVTIIIGCNSISNDTCTSPLPILINPTKSALPGVSDTWILRISTKDGSNNVLDSTNIKIATDEAVSVSAHIESTFTMAISGITDGTSINSNQYCGTLHSADTSNTGLSTTTTDVNLGRLNFSTINRAHQLINIAMASNNATGYVLTASSSGHLINANNGFFIQDAQGTPTGNDLPLPSTITTGTPAYGIHVCDANNRVSTSIWGQSESRFANPSGSFYYTLVNSNSQPIAGGDNIVIEYASSPSSTTPAGNYSSVITYFASVKF